ncbi:MAG: hypothetical protein ACSLE1_17155 [Sphingobium sp.]
MNRVPMPLLLLWSFFSGIVLVLGIGFAGGISNLFVGPEATGIVELAPWLIAWALVVTPFAMLLVRFVRRFML